MESLKLSEYLLFADTAGWIPALFQEETMDRSGNKMLRGFYNTGSRWTEISEVNAMHMHFGDYSENCHGWAYSDEQLLLYTYCEGDTTLTLFNDKMKYHAQKREYQLFYQNN